MSEISFYHLQSEPLDTALPRLLEKVRERGFRVAVRGKSEEVLEQLDEALWTFRPASFLAHGRAGDETAPEDQPVYLSSAPGNANSATVLVVIEDADASDAAGFDRCLYMFDGNDEQALHAARGRWKEWKDAGISVTYYQQTETGWQKKA